MDTTEIKYYEQEVADVVETITNMSNPFDAQVKLVNIENEKVAPADVSKDYGKAS